MVQTTRATNEVRDDGGIGRVDGEGHDKDRGTMLPPKFRGSRPASVSVLRRVGWGRRLGF